MTTITTASHSPPGMTEIGGGLTPPARTSGLPELLAYKKVEVYRNAFATLGCVVCDDDQVESGCEEAALFVLDGVQKHTVCQLPNDRWVSKLVPSEDIKHGLQDLTGMLYGSVALVMKRAVRTAPAA